jgi:hypothetical protein
MRSRRIVGVIVLALAALAPVNPLGAADPPRRKPLGPSEREAVLALMKAIDLAQASDATSDPGIAWDHHVLKAANYTAYLPFTLTTMTAGFKSTAMYVRAVSRHDGIRSFGERSFIREWVMRGGGVAPKLETVYVSVGEMPVGLAAGSPRQSVAGPASASVALQLQERQHEKEKAADAAAKKKVEAKELDPAIFPYEEYHFIDAKSARPGDSGIIERALSLPPGEYDVFVAIVDRAKLKTSSPAILKRTITVPDFWSDQLVLSSLVLAKDVRTLKTPFAGQQQVEHPYAFGSAEVVPAPAGLFTTDEALTVVFQMCNYGAPDTDLSADYTFFRVDGPRRLFNRTDTQHFSDADLPAAGGWESQAFASQSVPLQPFPPGQYELEVSVRDLLTRATAKATVAFTVTSGLR